MAARCVHAGTEKEDRTYIVSSGFLSENGRRSMLPPDIRWLGLQAVEAQEDILLDW